MLIQETDGENVHDSITEKKQNRSHHTHGHIIQMLY